jgi:hypothetical protein
MDAARFSYSLEIKAIDRERALALPGQEVEAARRQGLEPPAVALLRVATTPAETEPAES